MQLSMLLFIGLAVTGIFTETAHATSLFRFENRRENPGAFRLLPEITAVSTTENYNATGTKSVVSGLTSYSKTNFDFTGVYGVNKDLSVFGRMSITTVSFATSTIPSAEGKGLSEQGLGLNYRLWESSRAGESSAYRTTTFDGQFQLDLPFYDNVSLRTQNPRQPVLGDGTLDMTFAGFVTHPFNQGYGTRIYGIGGLGLMIRNNSYSKGIPYQLQVVGLPEKSGILYRAGFHGFNSMTTDTTTTKLSPQSEISAGTLDTQDAGGSYIADALNSAYMHFRATLGYQWGVGDQVYATYLMPMSGKSTAVLGGIIVGAQFRWPGSAGKPAPQTYSAVSPGSSAGKATHDIEGHVTQANDRLNLIKIDKGESDGIDKGNVIEIFRTNPDGTTADLIARGVVTSVTSSESVVNLRQYKKEVWVQPGFIARRVTPKKTQ